MTADAIRAGDVPGYAVVPSEDFPSIQAAHDALPADGGGIWLRADVTEQDIVFTKPIKLVGQGTVFDGHNARWRSYDSPASPDPGATIDTSGGTGITIESDGVVLRDVHIVGDYSGGYGVKIDGTESRGGHTLDNVIVARKGGHGFVLTGGQLNNRFDGAAVGCVGDGWHFACDWFNEHVFTRMVAYGCEGNGVSITQAMEPDNPNDQRSRFNGNSVQQFWMEHNLGWGLHVEDDVRMEGNHLVGYGIEHNHDHGEGPNKVIKVSNLRTPSWRDVPARNFLHMRNLIIGEIELDLEEFDTVIVPNASTPDGRIDLQASGQENG